MVSTIAPLAKLRGLSGVIAIGALGWALPPLRMTRIMRTHPFFPPPSPKAALPPTVMKTPSGTGARSTRGAPPRPLVPPRLSEAVTGCRTFSVVLGPPAAPASRWLPSGRPQVAETALQGLGRPSAASAAPRQATVWRRSVTALKGASATFVTKAPMIALPPCSATLLLEVRAFKLSGMLLRVPPTAPRTWADRAGTTLVHRACGRRRRPLEQAILPPPQALVQGVEATCGRTKALVSVASIILIITMARRATSASHPSRLGHRAKVHRGHRRHAPPFVGFLENIGHGSEGRESPSAAPTPQKRGPRRPPRTGRRGRLPSSLATPRREFVVYHIPYKDFLDTVMLFRRIRIGMELRTLVVAVWGGTAALAARAMVAGMAMAIMAPSALNIGRTVPLSFCAKLPLTTGGNAHASHGEVGGIGFIVKPFTPLHTEGRKEEPIAYDTVVWGIPPRSVQAKGRPIRILALTSAAPRRCGRAWNPVAGPNESMVRTPREIARTSFDNFVGDQVYTERGQHVKLSLVTMTIDGPLSQGSNDADAIKTGSMTMLTTTTDDSAIASLALHEGWLRHRRTGTR